ncbi:MAG: HDOD domain-containing protein [Fimbriimonadales bacterium]
MTYQTEAIVAKVEDLAVLPQVVHRIIAMTNDPNAHARSLEQLISIDQGMSMRVLNTVNSAYYGLPRKIASIKDAVVLLGFKTVRNLAMTASVFDLFVGKTDRQNLRRGKWWRHAIDSALCCRMVASQVPEASPDEAYTAGLLHDIGKPLLDRYAGIPYEQVEALLALGVPELDAEQEVFGCTHAELGRLVSLKWGFPEKLADAIGQHHALSPDDCTDPLLTAITAMGNTVAHWLREPNHEGTECWELLAPWVRETLPFQPTQLKALLAGCEAEIQSSPLQALRA